MWPLVCVCLCARVRHMRAPWLNRMCDMTHRMTDSFSWMKWLARVHAHWFRHTAAHYNTLQHPAKHYIELIALQNTATHCNTLQYTTVRLVRICALNFMLYKEAPDRDSIRDDTQSKHSSWILKYLKYPWCCTVILLDIRTRDDLFANSFPVAINYLVIMCNCESPQHKRPNVVNVCTGARRKKGGNKVQEL